MQTPSGSPLGTHAAAATAHEADTREHRHRHILMLLRRSRVASQQELAERLHERGIETTQSSLSRDLRELGIRKVAGRYVPPAAAEAPAERAVAAAVGLVPAIDLGRFVRAVKPAGPNLMVVLTPIGAAQAVGIALDRAGWPEVVGTLAGDDTVFVATATARGQRRLRERLAAAIAESTSPFPSPQSPGGAAGA